MPVEPDMPLEAIVLETADTTEGRPDVPLESIADTVTYVARAIEGLKDVLGRLDASITALQEDSDPELRIGRLFTGAQQHIDDVTTDARARARQIVAEAERQGARIVAQGAEEAQRVLDEATRMPVPSPQVMEQLQAAIAGFSRVNQDLVDELSSWWRRLAVLETPDPAPMSTPDLVPAMASHQPVDPTHDRTEERGPRGQDDNTPQASGTLGRLSGTLLGRDLMAEWMQSGPHRPERPNPGRRRFSHRRRRSS
jgi:hypothetical protein